jgi:hypothetical protein
MGWRDRAQPTDGGSDWKARAQPDAAPAPEALPAELPKEKSGADVYRELNKGGDEMNTAMWGALASGAHGLAHGMEGPINGAIAAISAPPMNEKGPIGWDGLVETYRKERDRIQGEQKQNLKDFPHAPIVGSMLGGIAGSAPTTLGRLGMGALEGGVYAAGTSDADLTKGESGKFTEDVLKGGGVGLAGAGVGELLQIPGRALGRRAQKLSDATHAAELAAEQEARAATVASTRGAYGGEVASGNRILENLADAITNPNADPTLKASAEQFLSSPEGQQLYNQVLRSNLGRGADSLGRIQGSRNAMAEAIMANDPSKIATAASSAAESKLGNMSGVTDRLAEIARRNLPPMIGGALGGPAGAAAGGVVAGAMGKQGTIMSNMLKSPSMFQPLVKGASVGMGGGQMMSTAAPPLAEYFGFLDDEEQQP